MIKIYTDAGFSYQKNLNEKFIKGNLAYKIGNESTQMIELHLDPIPNLYQYNNVYEFNAINFALQIALKKGITKIDLFTDSLVAYWWFKRKKNNLRKFSETHYQIKQEIDKLVKEFSKININHINRNCNLVGIDLEKYQRRYQKQEIIKIYYQLKSNQLSLF